MFFETSTFRLQCVLYSGTLPSAWTPLYTRKTNRSEKSLRNRSSVHPKKTLAWDLQFWRGEPESCGSGDQRTVEVGYQSPMEVGYQRPMEVTKVTLPLKLILKKVCHKEHSTVSLVLFGNQNAPPSPHSFHCDTIKTVGFFSWTDLFYLNSLVSRIVSDIDIILWVTICYSNENTLILHKSVCKKLCEFVTVFSF